MALGVPAIATRYSGNLDFMTEENSWLVDCRLVPVAEGAYPFAQRQVWAEPQPASALAMMERVLLDRAGAREKAARAQRDMATHFSPRACGLRYLERLAQLQDSLRKVA
jgi:hypothetical protein